MTYVRTNIEIDVDLVDRVMERHHLTTKKDAVDLALRYTAGTPLTQDFLKFLDEEVQGMGWDGDLDEIRNDHIEII
jgi:Arc/MetJ family transcription regulator